MDNKLNSFDDWLNMKVEEEAISGDLSNSGNTFADVLNKNSRVKEVPAGSNHGSDVDRYIKTVGLDPDKKALPATGYPWCMAFVYTMFDDFTNRMGIKNPLIKTAGVLDHWNKADRSLKIDINDIRSNPNLMKPGQIFIQDNGNGKGHTGIVVSVNAKNRTFTTIEGNGIERNTTTREGDKVVRNTRQMGQSNLVGVIDYFKGSRTEEFEKTLSTEVTGSASTYTEDTTNGGYTKPSSSSSKKGQLKEYYKIYDKENRRFLTAKYKGESFKVYNRRKVKVGEVFKKGESIFMDNTDITQTPVGIIFAKLFKYAESNKTLPNNNKSGEDYLTIDTGNVKPGTKLSPDQFKRKFGPAMIKATEGTPLLPSVKLAQAALETGWGKHVIGDANNMFGIKAKGSPNKYWDGSSVTAGTTEYYNGKEGNYNSGFRKYNSLEDSIKDHSRLLMTLPRYKGVLAATTPEDQARAIKAGGYATSPTYADDLISIINKYGFKSLDSQAGKMA